MLEYVLIALVVVGAGFALGKWLFTESEDVLARRKAAGQLSGVAKSYGLVETAQLLTDYSVGDYASLCKDFVQFCTAVLKDETAFANEVSSVFGKMLDAQLATPAGLALVQAKIAALSAPAQQPTVS